MVAAETLDPWGGRSYPARAQNGKHPHNHTCACSTKKGLSITHGIETNSTKKGSIRGKSCTSYIYIHGWICMRPTKNAVQVCSYSACQRKENKKSPAKHKHHSHFDYFTPPVRLKEERNRQNESAVWLAPGSPPRSGGTSQKTKPFGRFRQEGERPSSRPAAVPCQKTNQEKRDTTTRLPQAPSPRHGAVQTAQSKPPTTLMRPR